jgi:hypothetical protein
VPWSCSWLSFHIHLLCIMQSPNHHVALPYPVLSWRRAGELCTSIPISRRQSENIQRRTEPHKCEAKPCLLTPNPQGYKPKQEMKAQKNWIPINTVPRDKFGRNKDGRKQVYSIVQSSVYSRIGSPS